MALQATLPEAPPVESGHPWSYTAAFARNFGFVTEPEQEKLGNARIAIAGLGGVGGRHLLTLTRLGIGKFHIADPDVFEVANFNRQAGASLDHLGASKVTVMAEQARQINPGLELKTQDQAVNASNVDAFLAGVDLYVDGVDFFAMEARRLIFAACAERGIPAMTAAPLGMGVAFLAFLPGGMTFEQYFQLAGMAPAEQLLRFMVGLTPRGLHRRSLVAPEAIDLSGHRGPSTPMGADLCAGLAGAEALKLLLRRGHVVAAPRGMQFDAYAGRLVQTWRPGGNRHPLQRLTLALARRQARSAGGEAAGT